MREKKRAKDVDVLISFSVGDVIFLKKQIDSLLPFREEIDNIIVVSNCYEKVDVEEITDKGIEFVCFSSSHPNERINSAVREHVKSSLFLFLDDDSLLYQYNFSKTVSKFHSNPNLGVVGGKLLNSKTVQIVSCGKSFSPIDNDNDDDDNDQSFVFFNLFEGMLHTYRADLPSSFISTEKSGSMFRKNHFLKVHGFDFSSSFFFSSSSSLDIIDFCLKLQLERHFVLDYAHENWIMIEKNVERYENDNVDPWNNGLEEKWQSSLLEIIQSPPNNNNNNNNNGDYYFFRFHGEEGIVWDFGGGGCSGWFVEASSYVTFLQHQIPNLRIITGKQDFCEGLSEYSSKSLLRLVDRSFGDIDIWISHKPPTSYPDFSKNGGYLGLQNIPGIPKYVIGRSMYETTRIPHEWIEKIDSLVDEVWVPSTFVKEYFLDSGVPEEKVVLIPETIDPYFYDPYVVQPIQDDPQITSQKGSFNFFSVFKWEKRKGYEFLIEAYIREFSKSKDNTTLFLLTYKPYMPRIIGKEKIEHEIDDIVKKLLKEGKLDPRREVPNIQILCGPEPFPTSDMPSLYKSMDAFVLPTRGEGFGLPIFEAMLMELPVIATGFSGHLDFANEKTAFLIDVEMLEPVSIYFADDETEQKEEKEENVEEEEGGGGGGGGRRRRRRAPVRRRDGDLDDRDYYFHDDDDEEEDDEEEERDRKKNVMIQKEEHEVFASWARPSVDHLRGLMRMVVEDRELGLERGKYARKYLKKHFNPDKITGMIVDRLEYIREHKLNGGGKKQQQQQQQRRGHSILDDDDFNIDQEL